MDPDSGSAFKERPIHNTFLNYFSNIRYLAVPGSREADRELARFVQSLGRHWVACTEVFLTDGNHMSFLFVCSNLLGTRAFNIMGVQT